MHAGIQIGGAHIGVLIEGAADGQQQTVECGVVGNLGMADRAQKNRVAGLEQVDCARGHHAAPAEEVFGAPFEILKHESDIVLLRGLFKTRLAWGMTSVPTPSPAITAIVNVFMATKTIFACGA